jgi:predicted NBD/HSP70 family sugar kinase
MTSNDGQLHLLPTEAQELVARAQRRSDMRAAAEPRVDYKALNEMVRRQRAALTRAVNTRDPERVILVCRDAVREWNEPGAMWPDEWARWQSALDDVLPFHQQVSLGDLAD